MKRLSRKWNALMAVTAALLLQSAALAAKNVEHVKNGVVTRVVDGDTLWVDVAGTVLKVRITGMDAPEICQHGGREARDALRSRVLRQGVTLTYQRHDDYGRMLARLQLNGDDLGRWMVAQGHAWSYGYRKYPGPYGSEQQHAQSMRLGLFASSGAENPRDFRKRHGSCFR
ncbi:MAG: thermonuclease family protein [Pseudomonadota bacterium]